MAAKSKKFRVAVEGATTDGRKVDRTWLEQIAANYNRDVYGARIFCEHVRGYAPDSPFSALGDVLSVETGSIADGPLKGRLALYAEIEPNDAMVTLIKDKKKIYSSIEVDPSFADTGQAYLVGLGVTDSPASLGMEVLSFAAQHPDANPFTARKRRPENVFSEALETTIEIEPEDVPAPVTAGLFAKVKELLGRNSKGNDQQFADITGAVESLATHAAAVEERVTKLSGDYSALKQVVDAAETKFQAEITKLSQKIDTTEQPEPRRPAATGGKNEVATDC